jgi:hypothetical protein
LVFRRQGPREVGGRACDEGLGIRISGFQGFRILGGGGIPLYEGRDQIAWHQGRLEEEIEHLEEPTLPFDKVDRGLTTCVKLGVEVGVLEITVLGFLGVQVGF